MDNMADVLVVAFQNFVAGEFVEGTFFVHEDDVVAVFAGGNYCKVFEDAVFACFWRIVSLSRGTPLIAS